MSTTEVDSVRDTRGGPVAPITPTVLRPLPSGAVTLTGGFWGEWQKLNADVVLEHCQTWMERVGWIGNFDKAAHDDGPWEHAGIEFVDSEVYKLLEGMAWELGRSNDQALADRYESLVERVAAAQDDDGYLHTAFGRTWQPARYSNLEWGHELYCFGHLLQAAVARIRTTGEGLLVDVARRLADHVYDTFGPHGRDAICGHPEIEPALVEFGRATHDPRYIELARLFVERRGHGLLKPIEYGPEYFQDDLPVRDADVLRGHAVRALYLSAGALDVAVETGDTDLADALRRQWDRTVASRTYVTGGMGSHHQDEAFGADFELPPDRAYAETCAGIASTMFSWRLLLSYGDERYADLIERTLFNNVMASPREDGRAFFYTNTLHQRVNGTVPDEVEVNARALASLRAPWFEVSCCPTNVARTLASVESYFATTTADGLQIHQFGSYDIHTRLDNGADIHLRAETAYPLDGTVTFTWTEGTGTAVELRLRIPSWAENSWIEINDEPPLKITGRTASLRRTFDEGDTVTMRIPIAARYIHPDPRIDAVRGTVSVERGPLVLCLESIDLEEGRTVNDVAIDSRTAPQTTDTGARVSVVEYETGTADWPYGRIVPSAAVSASTELVPYARWANRGPSTMRVWIPLSQ